MVYKLGHGNCTMQNFIRMDEEHPYYESTRGSVRESHIRWSDPILSDGYLITVF